jgi:hypothetical protein
MRITCNGKNAEGELMTFTIKSGKLPDAWDQRMVVDGKLRLTEGTPTEAASVIGSTPKPRYWLLLKTLPMNAR